MIIAKKVRLLPTEAQGRQLRKSSGTARFVYNWALDKQIGHMKEIGKLNKITDGDLRKELTKLKQSDEYKWLYEVSNNTVHLEKVGKVKLAESDRIPTDTKYTNPRIKHDGKYWYISVGIEQKQKEIELTGETIGIDLGIKELATVSNIDEPTANINKTKEVRRLKKKLKRKQRQISRKYEKNKILKGKVGENRYKFIKTKNTEELEKETKLINRRLSNIRLNHIHQTTNLIVKTKPSRIVVEDLNVKGMMKNRHLSKAIAEQCFHMFIIILAYKCALNGIEMVKADRFYPSSKKCSCCGNIKRDLKLKDRLFICPMCNFEIDRDKNASINLSKYLGIA